MTGVVLRVSALAKEYAASGAGLGPGVIRAVDGVSFEVRDREALAVVGGAGSGKTALARCIAAVRPATSGHVEIAGTVVVGRSSRSLRAARRRVQLVTEEWGSSLGPRRTAGALVAETVRAAGSRAGPSRDRAHELLDLVGAEPATYDRRPAELSDAERFMVCLARALAVGPALLVCDDPLRRLDASARAELLEVLSELRRRTSLQIVYLARDLSGALRLCDRVATMHRGEIVEIAEPGVLATGALHPYTRALHVAGGAAGAPLVLVGDPPDPRVRPDGCTLHALCPVARFRCTRDHPALAELARGHRVACHFPGASPDGPDDGRTPGVTVSRGA